jgi:hypothetical protein
LFIERLIHLFRKTVFQLFHDSEFILEPVDWIEGNAARPAAARNRGHKILHWRRVRKKALDLRRAAVPIEFRRISAASGSERGLT